MDERKEKPHRATYDILISYLCSPSKVKRDRERERAFK
jgi:hypothetical protein